MKPIHQSFPCIHCHQQVTWDEAIGTAHRNHCPHCLWSKHVDDVVPGDRKSTCQSPMEPIGLTFKHEGTDKYGKMKQGELMLVHACQTCGKININRIAGDDDEKIILTLLNRHIISDTLKTPLRQSSITLLSNKNLPEIRKQLFGKPEQPLNK